MKLQAMGVLRRAGRAVSQWVDEPPSEDLLAASEKTLELLRHEVGLLTRHKNEFFDIIERIEAQRDEWRDMGKDSVGKYHTALAILERELRLERVRNAQLLVAFNKMRADRDLDPIKTPKYLDRELGIDATPVGSAKQYTAAVEELFRQGDPEARKARKMKGDPEDRPEDIDGRAERAALKESQAADG